MKKEPDVQLRYNQYIGNFYKRTNTKKGWRKFDTVGNTGEAFHMCDILKALGHKIQYIDETDYND